MTEPKIEAKYDVAIESGMPALQHYHDAAAPEIDRCTATSRMVEAAIGLNPFTR